MFKDKKGQTLVELIVAIAVIEIGLFSVWSLFLVNFNAEREAEYRIVGVNLAREGIEVIKNIRDSNWLKRKYNVYSDNNNLNIWTWDQNLEAQTCTVDFDSTEPEDESLAQLYLNNDGFYNNDITGKKTDYSRKIIIKDICCTDDNPEDFKCDKIEYNIADDGCGGDELKIGINVVSQVSWQISSKDRQATVEDNLYDWQ